MAAGLGGERIVVAGAGVAGLAVTLAAARAGAEVTLVEQDPPPTASTAEEAFTAERRGAPQVHQTHGFLARLTLVLRERYPDVLDALHAAGARALPLARGLGDPQPGDEGLAVLTVRRTTLEWVLRRAVTAEPNVSLLPGTRVTTLVAETGEATGAGGETAEPVGAIPHVVGARLDDGRVLPGTVVACTGVRGDVPGWLASVGADIDEAVHDIRLVYLTRWYRQRGDRGADLPPRLGGDLGYLKYLAAPCDQGTVSISMAVSSRDAELRSWLREPERFDAACRQLGGPAQLFRDADLEAIGPVLPMGGLVNRLRRFTDGAGQPRVTGFHAVGDAHTCTNPIYGRGCALAFVQATLLVDALAAHAGDPVGVATAYEAASAREVEPWFHAAVAMDRRPRRRAHTDGDAEPDSRSEQRGAESPAALFARIMAEGWTDPVLGRALIRVFNLLALPTDLFTDPEVAARVASLLAKPEPARREPDGPSRQDLLAGRIDP